MNKTLLKILVSTLILLIGIGAVSAIEHNSTDESLSVDQTDVISVIENNTEVISGSENNTEILSAENNNTVISGSENNTEILSAENNNTVISVSENNTEILSAENNNNLVSVSNDDYLTSDSTSSMELLGSQSQTEYKTFYLGKMKFLKKYKNMALYGYKTPSKKNKKAWKKHIAFQKAAKKQLKIFKKSATKVIKKMTANNWQSIGDPYYKTLYKGKYIYILMYLDGYRD